MDNYIYIMISLSIISCVLRCFVEDNATLFRYSMFCVGVITVCILVRPINQLTSELKSWLDKGSIDQSIVEVDNYGTYESFLLEKADEELKRSVSELANSKFGLSVSPHDISINYDADDFENVRILNISIDMRDTFVVSNVVELSAFISETLMCKCEVLTA